MAKATVVAVYFAVVFIFSVSAQTKSEINDQLNKEKALAEAYHTFVKAIDVTNNYDVDHFKNSLLNLLPAIRSLRRVFSFAKTYFDDYDGKFKLGSVKDGFVVMTRSFEGLDVGLSHLRDVATHNDTVVINWYKDQRARLGFVEHNLKLFAEADHQNEYRNGLKGFQGECKSSEPGRFLTERERTSEGPTMGVSALSGGNDRAKLMHWVRIITGDAARALSLHQACLGINEMATTQSRADKDLDYAWSKLTEIFEALNQESIRIGRDWDRHLFPEIKAQIDHFGMVADLQYKLHDYLSQKYNWAYFGVFVLNAEFDQQRFVKDGRYMEYQMDDKTVLVFWINKKDHDQDHKAKQDKIKAYLESVECVREGDATHFRSETIDEVAEVLREKGALAVFVTDGNFASRAYPQVSFAATKKCKGVEEWPRKTHWEYTRAIIVGY